MRTIDTLRTSSRVSLQLLDPYIPPRILDERLQGLLRYRRDQATFRGSTSSEGAALLLEETFGSLIWALHSATTHAFVLESLVYAKVGTSPPCSKDYGRAELVCTFPQVPKSIESCLNQSDSAVVRRSV